MVFLSITVSVLSLFSVHFQTQFCFTSTSHLSTVLQALALYFRGGAHWTESIDQCYHITEFAAMSIASVDDADRI